MAKKLAAELLAELLEAERIESENKYLLFKPYPKQLDFFEMGATKPERMFMAGNRLGKTEAGAYEMALHLTGLYPEWWKGYRFKKAIHAWAAGESAQATRSVLQVKLCGMFGVEDAWGTGMIPKAALGKAIQGHGAGAALDAVQVRHVSGQWSTCEFKSYEQGREKWQGATLDVVWLDEEPPLELYLEAVTRIAGNHGICFLTFTPLSGMLKVVPLFLETEIKTRGYVQMGLQDVTHFSPEEREAQLSRYPEYQRKARLEGEPMLGSGGVFGGIDEAQVREDAIPLTEVPVHWKKVWGVDFGISHPFCAVLCAWDVDVDVLHVLHVVRMTDSNSLQHAAAMTRIAAGVPVAWPHDGHQRDKGSGIGLAKIYKDHGLAMMLEHAHHPKYGNGLEASVMEMTDRARSGRLKVAAHLVDFWREYRTYFRKEGVIQPINDDVISATRYAMMMRRHAKGGALGPGRYLPSNVNKRQEQKIAIGTFDNPLDW